MRCATAEGTSRALLVITTDKKEEDMQRYVIIAIGIPSLTDNKVILLYTGIFLLEKRVRFIFEFFSYTVIRNVY
jgi:hypothetical protein